VICSFHESNTLRVPFHTPVSLPYRVLTHSRMYPLTQTDHCCSAERTIPLHRPHNTHPALTGLIYIIGGAVILLARSQWLNNLVTPKTPGKATYLAHYRVPTCRLAFHLPSHPRGSLQIKNHTLLANGNERGTAVSSGSILYVD
jgi:hypothetical protein